MPDPALNVAELLDLDRRHVWHPYGPMPGRQDPLVVESASGVRLRPADGSGELVDGMSSWWSAIHGYNHPVLNAAAREQLERMSHVMFGGLTHEPAVRLAKLLVDMSPEGLEHVFLADSGSVSVEVAVKMCLQYWRSLGRPGKHRLLTWRGGYHGDTWQPMSVCDPEGGMHELWSGVLPRQVFADAPPAEYEETYADHLRSMVERHAGELAAVIVEPVVQGAGGMRFHSRVPAGAARGVRRARRPAGLRRDRDRLRPHGRPVRGGARGGDTGRDVRGQGADRRIPHDGGHAVHLAGGRGHLAGRGAGAGPRADVHGQSAGRGRGVRVDRAAARPGLARRGQADRDGPRRGLAPAAGLPGVRDVRVLGAIGVVQLDHAVDMRAATKAAVREGVWLRPFRDLVYTMPPYVTGDADVARIARAVCAAAREG